ncbi:MAG: FIST C-terminal domain-containing protein [Myxococcaceae bacterium]|nr:FIST C-terminal domain-containing protein [Myxococcaceae bacterium]
MQTQVATALSSGSAPDAARQLTAMLRERLAGAEPKLVFAFASTSQPLGEVTSALHRAFPSAHVLGASTAGEFTEARDAQSAVSAFALAEDFVVRAGMGRGLKEHPDRAVADATELLGTAPPERVRTAFVLLDPLAGNGEEASLLIASALGAHVPLAGGAAGDDLLMKAAHVALDGEAAQDAVVVATLDSTLPIGVGVAHGHRALSAPLRVTRAQGNVVQEVEGRPAWDVWREHTAARARELGFGEVPPEREGAFLLAFEAGLAVGRDLKIRAPLSRNADGSINFACGIDPGSVIRITESSADHQVESARIAARRAKEALAGRPVAGAVVFDCICRKLILADRFQTAVQAISEELDGSPVAGFETYGEVALDTGGLSGFHNTTSVVVAFPRL